jgi:hypothetical protein
VAHFALLDPNQQTIINAKSLRIRNQNIGCKKEKTKQQKVIVGGILNSQTMSEWDLTELVSSI